MAGFRIGNHMYIYIYINKGELERSIDMKECMGDDRARRNERGLPLERRNAPSFL